LFFFFCFFVTRPFRFTKAYVGGKFLFLRGLERALGCCVCKDLSGFIFVEIKLSADFQTQQRSMRFEKNQALSISPSGALNEMESAGSSTAKKKKSREVMEPQVPCGGLPPLPPRAKEVAPQCETSPAKRRGAELPLQMLQVFAEGKGGRIGVRKLFLMLCGRCRSGA